MRRQALLEFNLICYGENSEMKILQRGDATKSFLSKLASSDRMTAMVIDISAGSMPALQRALTADQSTRSH